MNISRIFGTQKSLFWKSGCYRELCVRGQ